MTSVVDVVIPTLGRTDLIRDCLEGLAGQEPSHTVIVVDTGQGSELRSALEAERPDVRVVRFPENRGFGAAANLGIAAGEAPVVVLLNDDVVPSAGFLAELVRPLSSESRVGMVAALLVTPNGTVDSLGLEMDRGLAGFPRHWGRAPDSLPAAAGGAVGPTGGAAAYLRRALREAGGFDEQIPAYGEDRDLAIRLRIAGWSCAEAPGARATHLGSATFGRGSRVQLRALGHSRGYLLRKYGVMRSPRRAARVLASDGISILSQLARGTTAGLTGRIAGWRSGRRELPFPADLVEPGISVIEGVRRRRRFRG